MTLGSIRYKHITQIGQDDRVRPDPTWRETFLGEVVCSNYGCVLWEVMRIDDIESNSDPTDGLIVI